jgi:hypothetical protein
MSSNSRDGLTTEVFRPPRRTGSAAIGFLLWLRT